MHVKLFVVFLSKKKDMGYHINKIEKGVLGEFSKVKEEFQELEDAFNQDSKVLIICELTDLIGSVEAYAAKFNLTLDDLISFSNKTKESFKEGKR